MGTEGFSSLFAGVVLVAGMSVAVTPSAFADSPDTGRVQSCVGQAKAFGLNASDAASACDYARGGQTVDCAEMLEHNSRSPISDQTANSTCNQAAAPADSMAGAPANTRPDPTNNDNDNDARVDPAGGRPGGLPGAPRGPGYGRAADAFR
jgi:hypothetical protein